LLLARFFFVLLTFWSNDTLAGAIEQVLTDESSSEPRLTILLTTPLQYISHQPQQGGDELFIRVRAVLSGSAADALENNGPQTVAAEYSKAVPVIDVRYEPDTEESGVIHVRFKRGVKYDVTATPDRRSLVVSIVDQGTSPAQAALNAPVGIPEDSAIAPAGAEAEYIINLRSSIRPIDIPEIIDNATGDEYIVYTTNVTLDNKVWNRLRVGFFPDKEAAARLLALVKPSFPSAWIGTAGPEEAFNARRESMERKARKRAPAATMTLAQASTSIPTPKSTAVPPPAPLAPTRPPVPEDQIQALMEEARQAVARSDYARAIQLYTKVLEYPANDHSQDALEFLGVAREKNGQNAHAIKLYQEYLAQYPDGEGHDRVKQRLDGLTTLAQDVQPRLAGGQPRVVKTPWDIYGGLSLYYRRDEDTSDGVQDPVTQSSLSNDIDITARRRTDASDVQTRFTGSYLHDFLDNGSDLTSVSSMYVEALDKSHGISMKLGRQSHNRDGVLGRLDGMVLGYKANDWLKLNTIAGFPVQSTRDQLKTDRYLYGVSADFGPIGKAWDFNAFIVEQRADGLLDRRAIGGEARYFERNRSLLAFLDYDISYASLNTFIFLGTWRLEDNTTINASLDYRNSPILTTTNALQGQPVRKLSDLNDLFSENQIRQLAEDRTAKSTSATLGASHPFSEKFQLDGDVTVSKLSDSKDSGDLNGDTINDGIATPGTGYEFFYNAQFIGSSLIKSGDISILGLRYSDTQSANTTTLSINTRYPITTNFRVNPRARVDYRVNSRDNSTQWIYSPEFRTDYRWRKNHHFEAELGGEWSNRDLPTGTDKTSSYFFTFGYRLDF